MSGVVLVVQNILNQDAQRNTAHLLVLKVSNDSHYTVYSHIKNDVTGPVLADAYHRAFPNVGGYYRVARENLNHILSLLQQRVWPYCQKYPQCWRPNKYHHADLTISYLEALTNVPPQHRGSKLFNVPFIIFEVEGDKDVWARMEQEGKAMHEVVLSLAIVPKCFLVFLYTAKFSIWHTRRVPQNNSIEIDCEEIHLNGHARSIGAVLDYFLDMIV